MATVWNPALGGNAPHTTTKKKTTTKVSNVNVTKYDLNQVQGIATSAFQAALGRQPTSAELNQFLASLNSFSVQNPTKTTGTDTSHTVDSSNTLTNKSKGRQTTTSTVTGTQGSKTTSIGGVDVSNFATQYAQKEPGFSNYQKSTTYFDSMLSALKGPVGGSV